MMIMHQAAATMTGNAAIIALSIKKKKGSEISVSQKML